MCHHMMQGNMMCHDNIIIIIVNNILWQSAACVLQTILHNTGCPGCFQAARLLRTPTQGAGFRVEVCLLDVPRHGAAGFRFVCLTYPDTVQQAHSCTHLQQLPPQLLTSKLLDHIPVHLQATGVQVNIAIPGLPYRHTDAHVSPPYQQCTN